MSIPIIVGDPEQIDSLRDVNRYLSKILHYERKKKRNAGVLLVQRRQFGGLHEIVTEEEAKAELKRPIFATLPEFGVVFWQRVYFEALRERLRGNLSYPLPEPLTREQYKK